MYFSSQLRQARAAKRWSLQEAAKAAGLSAATIHAWEDQPDHAPVAAQTRKLNGYLALYQLAGLRFVDVDSNIGVLIQFDKQPFSERDDEINR